MDSGLLAETVIWPATSGRTRWLGPGMTSLLEAVGEPLQQPHPDFVLADAVLDAVFEVRIVVDLHDDDAMAGLLEVDAIKAVADRPRRAHRDIDHLAWRL